MRIIVLARPGASSSILVNYLLDCGYGDIEVILEGSPSVSSILRHRARRLGAATVCGQVTFMLLVPPLLKMRSRRRITKIMANYGLRDDDIPSSICRSVESVNDDSVRRHLTERQPDAVLVNGTRIIGEHILHAVKAPFINTHAGITPHYRGVHGGYWALHSGDGGNFGVTVHLVDAGVDTGDILFQARPVPERSDNFATYPLLQQASALPGLAEILNKIATCQEIERIRCHSSGRQWYHPTLVTYLQGRLRGVC